VEVFLSKNEEQKKEEKKKEIRVGDSIALTETVTVIKIRGEAVKELDKLPKDIREEILNEAVEATKGTIHPYDVTLEDVIKAKKRKGVQN
jgi:hypothetical protein